MKRKSVEFDKLKVPSSESDYNKRYGGLGLRDHRYPSQFKLDHNKKYEDDPEGKLFEITEVVSPSGEKKAFLAFVLSVVERAHSYDESITDNTMEVGLRLMPQNLHSFSEVGNLYLSIAFTVVVLLGFVLIVYFYILPEGIRELLLSFRTK